MSFSFWISLGNGNRCFPSLHEVLARLPRSLAPRVLKLVVVGSGSHELLILLFIPSPRSPPHPLPLSRDVLARCWRSFVRLQDAAILDHAHKRCRDLKLFINHFSLLFIPHFSNLPLLLTFHLHLHAPPPPSTHQLDYDTRLFSQT